MTGRTRLVFGSAYHKEYIDKKVFQIIHDFSCLPPAELMEPRSQLRYEIPHNHIAGFPDTDMRYYATIDTGLKQVHTEAIRRIHHPLDMLAKPNLQTMNDFDRITVHREDVIEDCNLLKTDAIFCAVIYQSDLEVTSIEGFGHVWQTRFRKEWICPYYPVHDPSTIVFRCRPSYAVDVIVDGYPSLTTIRRFLDTAMPRLVHV